MRNNGLLMSGGQVDGAAGRKKVEHLAYECMEVGNCVINETYAEPI